MPITIQIFIGGYAGGLRDQRTGLDTYPAGADSLHVSASAPQLDFDGAISIASNGRIPISEGPVKESFSL